MNNMNNLENNIKRQPTKEECLASYDIPIPEETLALATEKGLHIQRCDEVITKRKKSGKSKGKILATAKQAKGIRQTKICSYNVFNSQGKQISKGSFKLKLEDLVALVEQYEPTEDELSTDEYIPPFKHVKEKKHLNENRRELKKIGKELKYENGKFWILEANGDIAVGSENGFANINQVSNFRRKNYKNIKRVTTIVNTENVTTKNDKVVLPAPTVKKTEKTVNQEIVDYSEIKEKLATKQYVYVTDKYGTALYKILNISDKKMQIYCDWVNEQDNAVDPTLVIDGEELSIYKIRKTPFGEKARKNASMQKNTDK